MMSSLGTGGMRSSRITINWSPRFPSTSTNTITCNSSPCSCFSSSSTADTANFLYSTIVNVRIHVEKKRQLRVESQRRAVQCMLRISSSSAAAYADETIQSIFILGPLDVYGRVPILPSPSGPLLVLGNCPSSSCRYRYFFSKIKSWMSNTLKEMPILSPSAVRDLSPRMADIFLNSTKEAARRGHDPDQNFHLRVSVRVVETSATVKVESCCRETCSICLDESSVALRMPCRHAFHCACILNWLDRGKTTCPVCRYKFWS